MKSPTLAQRLKAADDHRDQRATSAILRDVSRVDAGARPVEIAQRGRADERPEVRVRPADRARVNR